MSILACFGSPDDVEAALRKERGWLVSCEGSRRVSQAWKSRKEALVASCITVLGQSPGAIGYASWVARKPERARLIRDARAFVTRAGNRAVMALVDLTLSDLEACRSFHGTVFCGPLEIKARARRTVTEARREQLAAAREARAARSRQYRETYEDRKILHLHPRPDEASQDVA